MLSRFDARPFSLTAQSMEQIRRIMRPTDVPDTGLLCDLLWSDPDKDVQGWGENDRGVSFTFGADVVAKFLNRHDMDLIARAHQVVGQYIRDGDKPTRTNKETEVHHTDRRTRYGSHR